VPRALRFPTAGELTDHIRGEHLVAPPSKRSRGVPRATLSDCFTRSGWAVPERLDAAAHPPVAPWPTTPAA
jgi:hypothetical protein